MRDLRLKFSGPPHHFTRETNHARGLHVQLTEDGQCDLSTHMQARTIESAIHEVLEISRVSLPQTLAPTWVHGGNPPQCGSHRGPRVFRKLSVALCVRWALLCSLRDIQDFKLNDLNSPGYNQTLEESPLASKPYAIWITPTENAEATSEKVRWAVSSS